MADNRSALHEAAKERTPEAQVEALERRADRAAAPIAPWLSNTVRGWKRCAMRMQTAVRAPRVRRWR